MPAREHARPAGPGPHARTGAARARAARALHALDRPDREGARHDGRAHRGADAARREALREAGHPVEDLGGGARALPVQAHGPALRLPDRGQDAVPPGGVDDEVLRREHAVEGAGPGDPGARGARLLVGHAARADDEERALGAAGRRRRRGAPDADREARPRRVPVRGLDAGARRGWDCCSERPVPAGGRAPGRRRRPTCCVWPAELRCARTPGGVRLVRRAAAARGRGERLRDAAAAGRGASCWAASRRSRARAARTRSTS